MALPGYYQNLHDSGISDSDLIDFEPSDSLLDNLALKDRSHSQKPEGFSSENSGNLSQLAKEKPFVCYLETCRKRFSQHCSLQKHERIHRGEKPFVCKICGHAFTQNSNLKRHERLHTGEKPYACDYCPKSFANVSNLKQHLQIHQEYTYRSRFLCEICSKSYYYLSSLRKHLKEHRLQQSKPEARLPDCIAEPEVKIESFCENQQKKVRFEVEAEGGRKKNLEISLEVDPSDIYKLPLTFQNILKDPCIMEMMQLVALKNGMKGSNPVESFERIRHALKSFFELVDSRSANVKITEAVEDSFLEDCEFILDNSMGKVTRDHSSEFSDLDSFGSEISLKGYDIEFPVEQPRIKNYLEANYPIESFYGVEELL